MISEQVSDTIIIIIKKGKYIPNSNFPYFKNVCIVFNALLSFVFYSSNYISGDLQLMKILYSKRSLKII